VQVKVEEDLEQAVHVDGHEMQEFASRVYLGEHVRHLDLSQVRQFGKEQD
jgi:hypothetical protein